MRRYREPFRLSETFCPNQFSVGYTINIFGLDFRQGQPEADVLIAGIGRFICTEE
jgi:hypothetical protein